MAKSKSASVVSPASVVSAPIVTTVTPESTQSAELEVLSALDTARNAVVASAKKTGDVIATYASLLCGVFNPKDINGRFTASWFELSGKAARPVRLERERFVAAFTEAGYKKPTIDVYWQRVKEASGYKTAGNRAKGELSIDEQNMMDVKTILNRIAKAGETGKVCNKSDDVADELREIFRALGGDVSTLK